MKNLSLSAFLIFIAFSTATAQSVTLSLEIEIDDFNIPGQVDELITYTFTLPNSVADSNPSSTIDFYSYSILSLSATIGGSTTNYLPSDLINDQLTIERKLIVFDPFTTDEYITFGASLPVPDLNLANLQIEAPLTLEVEPFYESVGGDNATIPTLTGNASDIGFLDPSGFESQFFPFVYLTNSSDSTVAGVESPFSDFNPYEISIKRAAVPELSTTLLGMISLLNAIFFRRRS